ncbi:LysR family transcriptional regulator [Micavibrio aeruginosavorus]|uniref:Bacterial regulatory helix-turn-helix, lysR family protein n=1 Tax=Micavibrio aeruginosavorus (strain ARL-13) TaxID=856793 RepID=G2KPU6_MICAA|nr:LysR family transcriptional regulator [Micavibrio aeruginosavorus]AEP09915.1 bacterial regulatory helix-turn-helix, lysR family protein [Micavibrio aeruginosavorus ARL-13]
MDWDKLRIFHAVAEAGSFTHAGETLNLSQSAVSRQISSLEESLGVTLFHRHARGLLLTEQGELLHKTARDIFGQLSMIEGQLLDSKQLPEGPLRITVAEFIGSTWLAPNLGRFREQYPDIQLTILLDDRILNLGMREADAAIRLYKPEQPDLIQRQLTTLNFRICASSSYLKKHGTPKDIKDLQSHTLIGFPENVPAPYADPNWLFRIAGVDPEDYNKIIMMNSLYAIQRAVESDAGIASLPDYMIRQNPDLQIILPEAERAGVDMYFVYPEERRHSRRIAILRDFLVENIQKTGK